MAEAAAVLDPFEAVDWFNLATKDDFERFATKEDLKQFATKEDLKQFATKEDLKQFATKDDLKQFVTKEELAKELATLRDLLLAEIAASEARSNARLSEELLGLSETLRKQTWAIVVGMPTVFAALLAILQTMT